MFVYLKYSFFSFTLLWNIFICKDLIILVSILLLLDCIQLLDIDIFQMSFATSMHAYL